MPYTNNNSTQTSLPITEQEVMRFLADNLPYPFFPFLFWFFQCRTNYYIHQGFSNWGLVPQYPHPQRTTPPAPLTNRLLQVGAIIIIPVTCSQHLWQDPNLIPLSPNQFLVPSANNIRTFKDMSKYMIQPPQRTGSMEDILTKLTEPF